MTASICKDQAIIGNVGMGYTSSCHIKMSHHSLGHVKPTNALDDLVPAQQSAEENEPKYFLAVSKGRAGFGRRVLSFYP